MTQGDVKSGLAWLALASDTVESVAHPAHSTDNFLAHFWLAFLSQLINLLQC